MGDSGWNVGFNDWMFLMDDGVLINRAYVTRYGIEIGQVMIAFRKGRSFVRQGVASGNRSVQYFLADGGAGRMALRTRGRDYGSSGAGETPVAEQSPDRLLEDICHELKLIDIKRKAIRYTTPRLPLYYAIMGLFGFLLAGSILALNIIFIFVFGTLFSGALANIVGPVGALTHRKRAYADIAAGKERLFPMLPRLPASYAPVLVGVTGITKSSILFTEKYKPLRGLSESDISTAGAFDFGSYKHLAVVFRDPDGAINLKHDAMRRQYWLTEAKLKGNSDTAILGALEKLV